jgi:molybdenum cofactor guanylyltransferase
MSGCAVVILAGGRSQRMGCDKAFLALNGIAFVKIITDEMLKISEEVIVMVGKKNRELFQKVVDRRVRVEQDAYDTVSPMTGIISACNHVSERYSAFLGCDTPLMKGRLISFLFEQTFNRYSASIPVWENGDVEPLCSVYEISQAKEAGLRALRNRKMGCRNLISFLRQVNYVNVSELKRIDPELTSFVNVNTLQDYENLQRELSQRS